MAFRLSARWLSWSLLAVVTMGALAARAGAEEEAPATEEVDEAYSSAEREHWSYQPLRHVSPPTFSDPAAREWIRTPVDAFILRALTDHDLQPAPRADRRTLIRRVTFDLTGLPPTPEQVEAFVAEPDFDAAWVRLIDRLLASPDYGVRWGQHWLDVIRFAESEGFEYDRHLPGAWAFRDYVIHAFNADKPFDEFVREQLAGDEMVAAAEVLTGDELGFDDVRYERRVAAGFHRLGPVRRNAGNAAVAFSRNEVLTERTNIIGSALLGVSLGCARCHDHKFDAIRQADYYRMQAFLASTFEQNLPMAEETTYRDWQAKTDAVQAEIDKVRDAISQAADEEEARLKKKLSSLQKELPDPLPTLLSVRTSTEQRSETHLLARGDETRPGRKLGMRPLGVLLPVDSPELPAEMERPKSYLADWIVDPENPLTPRVIVNRIWQHHFGRGLVSTPNDFGVNGQQPSHPELLDWLAAEFIRGEWSIKSLHRLLLMSNCYLQSSRPVDIARAQEVDPDNVLLWKYRRRRLSAEELRDGMLAVSGRLNRKLGGPSVIVPVDPDLVALLYNPEQWEVTPDASEHARRSIFLMAKRNLRLPFLDVFDQPDLQTSCARRRESTHSPQALEMVNGEFANEMARAFAERLTAECGDDKERQVNRAWALATGRPPTESERKIALEFLATQPAATRPAATRPLSEFALAILNLNRFIYVD